jgi:hypothetical protein
VTLVLCVLLQVESSGGTNLRDGDRGRAVGPYQMWTVAVDEANRIEAIYARRFGREPRKWAHNDRRDPVLSREMCELTLMWHFKRGTTDPVRLACRWRNPYSRTHRGYRTKIKKALEKEL